MHWLPKVSSESQWKHNGKNVSEKVLYRRHLEPREGYRRGKMVMELVVASVELGMMQDTVDIICQDFTCYVAVYKLSQRLFKRG